MTDAAHDTLGSAAARLGVPKGLLSKAKKAGAPGFKGSRVYVSEELLGWLLRWLYETGGLSESDKLDRETKKEKLRQLKELGARERGDWIEWAIVEAWQRNLAEAVKSILRNKLKNELPPKLEGLRAPEIAAKMDGVIAELIAEIRRGPKAGDAKDQGPMPKSQGAPDAG